MTLPRPKTKYILDANVFIQAKRQKYYGFDCCPGFWDFLSWSHGQNRIFSIDRVRQEIETGEDDLADWAVDTIPNTFFKSTQEINVLAHYQSIITWVQSHKTFQKSSKDEFASNADGWLIAFAKATGYTLVTLEKHDYQEIKAKIPNVCKIFGVPHIDTFDMLRALNTNFIWQPPS
ncbi:MAG: hypothetical protein A2X49_12020 [Lentisphaerae bacterium GWF2_52_8]|nr:MAG: hypothetical protein A2X49_12020 [Lentisphaerae bacterium GWF2_52_8]